MAETTAVQRRATVIACVGIIPLVVGLWMFNASHQDSHYSYLETPGALLGLIGITVVVGAVLVFAWDRLRG